MTREEMIKELIEHEIEVNYSDKTFIREVLLSGLTGYNDMTDEQIKEEYEQIDY